MTPARPGRLAAAAAIVLAGLFVAAARPAAQTRPPNIVFVLADDLGINDLGVYGRSEHKTPNLDRLAAEGLRFTSAYVSSPICSPSRAALMTGRAPARLHLTTFIPGRANTAAQMVLHPEMRQRLPLEEVTLAERLRGAGYATAAIGKWHLGDAGFSPLEQGFDVYHAGQATTTASETEGGKGEYDLTRAAMRFVDANRDRPFFLYLPHNNPHIPFHTAKPALVEANQGAFDPAYAATVETLDDAVGRLVAHIDASGLRERTIVIFSSDNGGLHMPEGRHQRMTHNTPFRAGKGYLYEGGLRVPLIVRGPGIAASRVIDAPVANADWLPTLLELAGVPPAPDTVLDGVSQAALLRTGTPGGAARTLYWHLPHYTNQGSRPAGAVRDGRWKLVEHYDNGQVELFDLQTDIGESRDLSNTDPARTADLRRRLREWLKTVRAQENAPNPGVDRELYRRIYVEFDSSRFDPLRADAAAWKAAADWRQQMDAAVKRAQAGRPNVLLLLTDDQRYGTIRALGHPDVFTPHLDRLVARGTTFLRAHIMGGLQPAICAPSRAMLLTGRELFSLSGNGSVIPPGHTTLPETLRRAGYTTFATGKWHNDRATYARAWTRGDRIFFGGMHWPNEGGHEAPWLFPFDPAGAYPESSKAQARGFSSAIYASAAVEFIERQSGSDPFFAYVAFTSPHDPRTPPPEFARLYDPAALTLPPNVRSAHPFDNGELSVRDELLLPRPLTEAGVRRELASYYAMISEVDAQIGRILDALDRRGLTDRTLVVFAGDNGLSVGSQGLLGKQNLYEESVRVPLVFAGPGIPRGETRDQLALLSDVFPTIASLTGVAAPGTVQGLSLAPALREAGAPLRDEVFYAYRGIQRGLRTADNWKVIEYRVGGQVRRQLFNLNDDPMELRDLAAVPEARDRAAALERRLHQAMRAAGDPLAPAPSGR